MNGHFGKALTVALETAARSPSSHNCQPWAVAHLTDRPGKGEYLLLALDKDRELNALRAHATEMLLSCGIYWHIMLRTLAAQGWHSVPTTLAQDRHSVPSEPGPCPDLPSSWVPLRAALFEYRGTCDGDLEELQQTVRTRRTVRAPYQPTSVTDTLLDGIADRTRLAVPEAKVLVHRLPSPRAFARFVARHGGRDFGHSAAWRETHSFIRWSETEAARSGDGFTPRQLFGPLSPAQTLLRRAALAPVTMNVLRHVGFHHLLAHQLAAVVRSTPVIVVMSLDPATDEPADLLDAGAYLAEYWLNATRAGLALHPISIVLQHEDLRRALRRRFHLTGRPFFASRLGYPETLPETEVPPAIRRPSMAPFRIH